jgi:inner membrane protein
MVGKTHVVFGLATVAAVNAATGLVQPHPLKGIPVGPVLCLSAAVLGALLPDLDAEEGSMLQVELGEAGLMVAGWLQSFTAHRGLTHYGLTALLMTLIPTALTGWFGYGDVGLAFGLGYVSHILADAMTLAGVPLLGPWKSDKLHLLPRALRLRSGGPVEPLVFVVATVIFVVFAPALVPEVVLKYIKKL